MTMRRDTGTPIAMPWDQLMTAGLGQLRLSPTEFWNMTVPELDAALTGAFGSSHVKMPARRDLSALMAMFPDLKERSPNG